MWQAFFEFFERFIKNFSWKHIYFIFAVFVFGTLGFYFYESITATNQLTKYERTVKILKSLENINMTNKDIQSVIKNINLGLMEITKENSKIQMFNISVPMIVKQILLNVSSLLFMALFLIPSVLKGENESFNALGGIFAFIFLISVFSYFSFNVMQAWFGFYLSALLANLITPVIIMIFKDKDTKNSQ